MTSIPQEEKKADFKSLDDHFDLLREKLLPLMSKKEPTLPANSAEDQFQDAQDEIKTMIEGLKAQIQDLIDLQVAESQENFVQSQNELQSAKLKASQDLEEIQQLRSAMQQSEEENSKLREQIQR